MTTKFVKVLDRLGDTPTKEAIKSVYESSYEMSFLNSVKEFFQIKRPVKTALELLPRILKLFRIYYPKPATLAVKLSEVRKVIKAKQPETVYKKSTHDVYFNLPEEARLTLKNAYIQRVRAANMNLVQISMSDLLERIRALSEKTDKYSRGVLLMVISGMRPIELFRNVVRPAENPANIIVSNLAKKKNTGFSVERPIIMFSAEEFITRLTSFRQLFESLASYESDGQLAANITRGFSKASRAAFPDLPDTGLAGSMMRKYYTVLAYETYADKSTTNYNAYIQSILGHTDLQTTFSYSTINIDTDSDASASDSPAIPEPPAESQAAESQPAESPPIPAGGPYPKLKRLAPREEKWALLERIYRDHPNITNPEMRALSGIGSRLTNEFLKSRR